MAAVQLACGHHVEVDHVRGDRRVQCPYLVDGKACGGVSCVSAEPQQAVTYAVRDLVPAPAESGRIVLLPIVVAGLVGFAIALGMALVDLIDQDDTTEVRTQALVVPSRDLAEATTTTSTSTTTTSIVVTAKSALPAGGWTWDELAECESNGRWDIHDTVHEGGLQFAITTWDAYKPAGYPDGAHQATREQQIAVAELVLADQGPGAWPHCSYVVGMR